MRNFLKKLHPLTIVMALVMPLMSLAGTINVKDYGAKPDPAFDSGKAIQTALSAAGPGDIIVFPAGDYFCMRSLIHNNGTLTSQVPNTATIQFSNGGAFAISAGASANAVDIGVHNNGGDIIYPSGMNRAVVSGCDLIFNGTGQNAVGVRSMNGMNNSSIEFNNFHNSENSYRDCDLWDIKGISSYSDNEFNHTFYGGHLIISDGTLTIARNIGTGYNQMGLVECQDFNIVHGKGWVNFLDNIVYGWRTGSGQNNAFGSSFGTQYTGGFFSRNNYTALGDWINGIYREAVRGGGSHWGYGREVGGMFFCTVDGDITIGSWVQGFVTMSKAIMKNVKVFGQQEWGPWGTESGNEGQGQWASIINSFGNLPISQAPQPPHRVTGKPWLKKQGGTTQPTTDPTTQPVILAKVTVSNISEHEATVLVTEAPAGAALGVRFKNNTEEFDLGTIMATVGKPMVVTNFPKSWELLAIPVVDGSPQKNVTPFRTAGTGGDWPWTTTGVVGGPMKQVMVKPYIPPIADFSFNVQFKSGVFSLVFPQAVPPEKRLKTVTLNFQDGTSQTLTVP